MANYTIHICPNYDNQTSAIIYNELDDPISVSSDDDGKTVEIDLVPTWDTHETGKVIDFELCPENSICSENVGCDYSSNPIWDISSWITYKPTIAYTIPNYCNIRRVDLRYYRTSDDWWFLAGDMVDENISPIRIYPDGDDDNPECPACGLGNLSKTYLHSDPVPGTKYTLTACIEDSSCGELDCSVFGNTNRELGSVVFETDSLAGGKVISIIDNGGYKTFTVRKFTRSGNLVIEEDININGIDLFEPSVGDWVLLLKLDCDGDRVFPADPNLDWSNFCTTTNYKVIPFDPSNPFPS